MALLQVADGGNGLQIWRVAANERISSRGQLKRGGLQLGGCAGGGAEMLTRGLGTSISFPRWTLLSGVSYNIPCF